MTEKDYKGPCRRKPANSTEELLEQLADRVVEKLKPDHACRFGHITVEEHEAHHEMCASAIALLDRLNSTKWGVFKAVAIFLALGLMTLIGAGLTWKIRGGV